MEPGHGDAVHAYAVLKSGSVRVGKRAARLGASSTIREVLMRVRRGVPSFVLTLFVLIALAVGAPTASAASVDKVKGGQSALFVPFSRRGEARLRRGSTSARSRRRS